MSGRKGFTLIELMTVVAIIAVLAAIGIPGMVRYRASGQAAKCVSNLRAIQVAREAAVAGNAVNLAWNNISVYLGDAASSLAGKVPKCPLGGTANYSIRTAVTDVMIPPECPNYDGPDGVCAGHTLGWKTYVATTP